MKLDPKTLIAETIKFFQQNPTRWVRNKLTNKGDNYLSAASTTRNTDCFCAVGYMAVRLKEEGLISGNDLKLRPYDSVGNFLRIPVYHVHGRNDGSNDVEQLADRLKELL